MKLRVEGAPEELLTKGPDALRSLARRLGVDPLDLVHEDDILAKAETLTQEPVLKHDALKGMNDRERRIVRETYKEMNAEIGKILDSTLQKSAEVDYTAEMVEEEAKLYEKVQSKLKARGYEDSDFEPNGRFYGMSTNELLDFLED